MKRCLTGPVKEGFRKNRILFPQTSIFCSKSSSNYYISFDICLAKFYFEGTCFYYIYIYFHTSSFLPALQKLCFFSWLFYCFWVVRLCFWGFWLSNWLITVFISTKISFPKFFGNYKLILFNGYLKVYKSRFVVAGCLSDICPHHTFFLPHSFLIFCKNIIQ